MKYIKSYEVKEEPEHMGTAIIRFTEMMEVLSSAPYNGGHTVTDTVFIMQVPHDYACLNFQKDLEDKRLQYGLPEHAVGLMTAAEVKYVFSATDSEYNGCETFVACTAGVTNAVCAGEPLTDWEAKSARSAEIYRMLISGTINIVAVSPIALTDAGKINLMMPIIEGKSMGMHDCGYRETGTTSDALALVSPISDDRKPFSGTGTPLGIAIARGVRKTLKECLRKRGEHPEGTDTNSMLKAEGVTNDHIWQCAEALGMNDDLKDMFYETLENMGADPDICSVVMGALFCAHQAEKDAVYGMYEGDFPLNLVDGSMASFLASRISEDRGRDRVTDLMSIAPLNDTQLAEHIQLLTYGLVAGVVGYITGYTDE